jgi:hypothetical protein
MKRQKKFGDLSIVEGADGAQLNLRPRACPERSRRVSSQNPLAEPAGGGRTLPLASVARTLLWSRRGAPEP